MAKKASGKNYISQGKHSNVARGTLQAMRKDSRERGEKEINIQSAWLKGKNPWVTISNPNKEQKDRLFIRVKSNDIWGSPKERFKKAFVMGGA